MDQPIKLETENVFDPEEKKEDTFEDLLEEIPAPFANYLKGMKQIVNPLLEPRPIRFAPVPAIYKVRVLQFDLPTSAIEYQLSDLLNDDWSLRNWIPTATFLICIFVKEKDLEKKEDSTNHD